MLVDEGKRLPSVLQYAASLLPLAQRSDDLSINQYGMRTDPQMIAAVETGPGRFRLMPGPEFSPRLYRGQNSLFTPCHPSLYRQAPIDRAFWTIKRLELDAALQQHPACMAMIQWELEGLAFDFNLEALAQHYGYPTRLLDFSRSEDVAMFFATCGWDPASSRYVPLESGTAVLYTVDLRTLLTDPSRPGTLPLGLEPLPRPAAQQAFAVPFRPGEDLNQMPWTIVETIQLTPELGRTYFDMFEEGHSLFPSNPFDNHIDGLRNSRHYSMEALKRAIAFKALPPHLDGLDGIVKELAGAAYHPSTTAPVPASIVLAASAEWQARSDYTLPQVGRRGVADHFTVP